MTPAEERGINTSAPTAPLSQPGIARGTPGYMSPEQVLGDPIDHRTDIFAFGAVLYEMLTGLRVFHGASPVEIMNAILKDDAAEQLEKYAAPIPGLAQVVRRCLEKNPEERFQSTRDLTFHLKQLLGVATGWTVAADDQPRRWLSVWGALAALLGAAAAAAAIVAWRAAHPPPRTTFQQMTFKHGRIASARFAPNGQSIVYSEAHAGQPLEAWYKVPGSAESRTLGYTGADVLGISRSGE